MAYTACPNILYQFYRFCKTLNFTKYSIFYLIYDFSQFWGLQCWFINHWGIYYKYYWDIMLLPVCLYIEPRNRYDIIYRVLYVNCDDLPNIVSLTLRVSATDSSVVIMKSQKKVSLLDAFRNKKNSINTSTHVYHDFTQKYTYTHATS